MDRILISGTDDSIEAFERSTNTEESTFEGTIILSAKEAVKESFLDCGTAKLKFS